MSNETMILLHPVSVHGNEIPEAVFSSKLRKRFPGCYACYRDLCKEKTPTQLLGGVQIWSSNYEIYKIVNLYVYRKDEEENQLLDEKALENALSLVRKQWPKELLVFPFFCRKEPTMDAILNQYQIQMRNLRFLPVRFKETFGKNQDA